MEEGRYNMSLSFRPYTLIPESETRRGQPQHGQDRGNRGLERGSARLDLCVQGLGVLGFRVLGRYSLGVS